MPGVPKLPGVVSNLRRRADGYGRLRSATDGKKLPHLSVHSVITPPNEHERFQTQTPIQSHLIQAMNAKKKPCNSSEADSRFEFFIETIMFTRH
jgi:hypothetical protein